MPLLSHLVEPARLLMTWQPSDEGAPVRTRRIVGEVAYDKLSSGVVFRYARDSKDYQAAVAAGFKGFPAFRLEDSESRQGVLESLMRRLPPRNREDFSEYLQLHGLAAPFKLSDMALLGYTGARLPSDGFALVPEFPLGAAPCDYVMESPVLGTYCRAHFRNCMLVTQSVFSLTHRTLSSLTRYRLPMMGILLVTSIAH